MKRPWAALGLVLALSVIMPGDVTAQVKKSAPKPILGANFPNPYNPETRFRFQLGGYPNCTDNTKLYRVSARMYDVLMNLVAIPVLDGGAGGVAGGTPLNNVMLPCGNYTAWWDGKVRSNGREAASGMYVAWLDVDGVIVTRKTLLAK